MSVIFTGTNQGKFTSTGASQTLNIRSGVDWIKVLNYTDNTQYFWQYGMAAGVGKITAANGTTASLGAGLGFFPIDTSDNVPGPVIVTSAISGANPPNVICASTASIKDGDIVQIGRAHV